MRAFSVYIARILPVYDLFTESPLRTIQSRIRRSEFREIICRICKCKNPWNGRKNDGALWKQKLSLPSIWKSWNFRKKSAHFKMKKITPANSASNKIKQFGTRRDFWKVHFWNKKWWLSQSKPPHSKRKLLALLFCKIGSNFAQSFICAEGFIPAGYKQYPDACVEVCCSPKIR